MKAKLDQRKHLSMEKYAKDMEENDKR